MKYGSPVLAGALFAVASFLILIGGRYVRTRRRRSQPGRRVPEEPGRSRWTRLSTNNYRGVRLPLVLGLALGSVAFLLLPLKLVQATRAGSGAAIAASAWVLGAAGVVFVAGLIDDLFPGGPRGLRGHVRKLVGGKGTTGILKMVASVVAGLIVVVALPGRGLAESVLGIVVIAGAANVWNGLDVRPGRAGKAFLVVSAGLCLADPPGLLLYVLGAELGLIWFDLREWAMLGDAGSNLLGFVAGVAIYWSAGSPLSLAAAAAVVVALNIAAETITFSRIIDAIRPLRWFDLAGTLPERRSFSPGE